VKPEIENGIETTRVKTTKKDEIAILGPGWMILFNACAILLEVIMRTYEKLCKLRTWLKGLTMLILLLLITACSNWPQLMGSGPAQPVPETVRQDPLAPKGNVEEIVGQLRTKYGQPRVAIIFADNEYSLQSYEWDVGDKTYVVIKRNGEYRFVYTRENPKKESSSARGFLRLEPGWWTEDQDIR
jgi:hypothetical protein